MLWRFPACLSLLLSCAHAVTLEGEERRGALMRRDGEEAEKRSSSVQLGASGEVTQLRNNGDQAKARERFRANVDRLDMQGRVVNTCNDDYVEGHHATDNCTDTTHYAHILEPDLCEIAAHARGIPIFPQDGGFMTLPADYTKHPRGCYKDNCSKAGGQCYFFNAIALWPDQPIVGAPVCTRPKILLGTANTNGFSNGTCLPGYSVIENQALCSEAAVCLDYCEGSEFVIGQDPEVNRSKHDEHPRGCFIESAGPGLEQCGYYNPVPQDLSIASRATWAPSHPQGVSICSVTGALHVR